MFSPRRERSTNPIRIYFNEKKHIAGCKTQYVEDYFSGRRGRGALNGSEVIDNNLLIEGRKETIDERRCLVSKARRVDLAFIEIANF